MLIDSHTHLQHRRYHQEEPQLSAAELIEQFQQAGVGHVVNIACWRPDWAPALALCAQYPNLVTTAIGIHPQDVAEAKEPVTVEELVEQSKNPHVVALGETGLDYYYDTSPKDLQHTSFHTHLQAAKQTGLPVVIHTRDAEADTIEILKQHPGVNFVLHCFTGTPWLAEEGIKLGGYISFSGILTFKKSQELRDIAASLPRDRVLIETDAPYLAPEPFRSKRNAPSLLPHTAQVLAKVWQVSAEEVAEITTANTRRLFSRIPNV